MQSKPIKVLIFILRLFFIFGPICWIFWNINYEDLKTAIVNVANWALPIISGIILFAIFLQGLRWWILLRAITPNLPLKKAMNYHLCAGFYSLILPTGSAQDAIRTILVAKETPITDSIGVTWILKLFNLVCSLVFSIVGLCILAKTDLPPYTFQITIIFAVFLILLILASFSKKLTRPFRKFGTKLIPAKFISKIEQIRQSIYEFKDRRSILINVFLISFLLQILFTINISLLLKAISGHFYLLETLAFMPLIEIISVAQPFTPNGMGVREILVTLMFKKIGLTQEQLGIYTLFIYYTIFFKAIGVIPVIYNYSFKRQKPSNINEMPQP